VLKGEGLLREVMKGRMAERGREVDHEKG